jgi:hypothetical protein
MIFGDQGVQVPPAASVIGTGILVASPPTDGADHDEFFTKNHWNIHSFRSGRQRSDKILSAVMPAVLLIRNGC